MTAGVARRDVCLPGEVARLLESVPEWFGQPEATADYVEAARTMETWSVRNGGGRVIGITLVQRPFAHVAEIHLMVVNRTLHGEGAGSEMLRAIEADAAQRQVRFLEVKTLGPSSADVNYARTRHFYEKAGFLALDEIDLWGPLNPCLIMVKPLTSH